MYTLIYTHVYKYLYISVKERTMSLLLDWYKIAYWEQGTHGLALGQRQTHTVGSEQVRKVREQQTEACLGRQLLSSCSRVIR